MGHVFCLVGTADDHLDGRRRAETHDLVDNVGGLERNGHLPGAVLGDVLGHAVILDQMLGQPGLQPGGHLLAKPLLDLLDPEPFFFVQGDADDGLVGAAGPEEDGVGGQGRRGLADVGHRDPNAVGSENGFQFVQRLAGQLFGEFQPGADRGLESHLE